MAIEPAPLRLVNAEAEHEIEIGTKRIRRFLDIHNHECLELTFFAQGGPFVAQATGSLRHMQLLREAERLAGYSGAYQLFNGPIHTALLHRYQPNLISPAWNGRAGDMEVHGRRAIFIDIKPIRPKGVSATADEKRAAEDVCRAVEHFLVTTIGDPAALGHGDSGNGCFILIATEVKLATPDDTLRINQFLKSLACDFNTHRVTIDTSVGNVARLMPCPGTWIREGGNTPERPHRRVYFSCNDRVRRVPLEAVIG